MAIQDDFPIGCEVEVIASPDLKKIKTGTKVFVLGYTDNFYLIIKWPKDACLRSEGWNPCRFRRIEQIDSKLNLKMLNSRPEAKVCVQCSQSLKSPYPGIKYCPKCET